MLVLPGQTGLAVQEVFTAADGLQHFKCKRPGRVGKARVKMIAPGLYRVFGPWKSGKVSAGSALAAAREACGENRKKPAQ